jgi:TolB protein
MLAIAFAAIVTVGGCGDEFDLFPGVTEIGAPSWSSDGSALVFHLQKDGMSEIYRVDMDDGDVERLTSAGAYSRSPAWAPDGSRLAFTRSPDDVDYALYLAESDGSNARRIFGGGGAALDHPSWSPDGKRIALVAGYVDHVLGSAGRLLTIRVDGGGPRWVNRPGARSPAWSPDDRWIAYSRSGAGWGVYVVPAEGGRERLVIKKASDPAWSPDGRRLAVSRGINGIFVVPIAGGRAQRLPIPTSNMQAMGDLAWSPDGRRIAFATAAALYVADIDGSGIRRVASLGDA